MFLYTRNNSPKFYFRPFNARCQWANSKQFVISNLFKNSVYFLIWANSIRTKTICKCRKAKTRGEKNYVYRICLQATNVKSTKLISNEYCWNHSTCFLQFQELTWTKLWVAGLIHWKCTNAVSSKSFTGRVITSPGPCLHTTSTRFGTITPCTPKRKSTISI